METKSYDLSKQFLAHHYVSTSGNSFCLKKMLHLKGHGCANKQMCCKIQLSHITGNTTLKVAILHGKKTVPNNYHDSKKIITAKKRDSGSMYNCEKRTFQMPLSTVKRSSKMTLRAM